MIFVKDIEITQGKVLFCDHFYCKLGNSKNVIKVRPVIYFDNLLKELFEIQIEKFKLYAYSIKIPGPFLLVGKKK